MNYSKEYRTLSDFMNYHNTIGREGQFDEEVRFANTLLTLDQQNIMALGLLLIHKLDDIANRTGNHCSKCCN